MCAFARKLRVAYRDTREEAGLRDAEEDAGDQQAVIVTDNTHESHDNLRGVSDQESNWRRRHWDLEWLTLRHTMMNGSHTLGLNFLRSRLLGTSKAEYVKKKTVRHQLYWSSVMLRSSCRPSIFALPMFPPKSVRKDLDTCSEGWTYGRGTRGDIAGRAWG